MEELLIKGSDNTPDIKFNSTTGEYWIQGNSYSNNPAELYSKLINWVEKNVKLFNGKIVFHLSLNYIDSSSKKGIFGLIKKILDIKGKEGLQVFWHYKSDDTDMLDTGKEFSAFFETEFSFVED